MMVGINGYSVEPVFTVGEQIGPYTPPGILDGMGAYKKDSSTIRLLANHELLHFRGYPYKIEDGTGDAFTLTGARISFFDFDRVTKQLIRSGPAYTEVYDANGNLATDPSFLANNLSGFSRFCAANLEEANRFGFIFAPRGIEDTIFFTNEEDGGNFNPVGGAYWALDVSKDELWHVPAFGRGAWESCTQLDTGREDMVAFLLADDSSPFDADDDSVNEAAPLYLYVGYKFSQGNFLQRNGLAHGDLYVFVANDGSTSPLDFRGQGTLKGRWKLIDNFPNGTPSEDGSTGFDEYGYPTQRTLWTRAEDLGAFGFSRPEDCSTFPWMPNIAVLASTGVDTYAVDTQTGDGVDTFGTIYTVHTNFSNMKVDLTILYDGDADPDRKLRSPDNLDWADDGFIYIQEDEAEEDTLATLEPLFGPGAVNPNEAGIVRMDWMFGDVIRVANIDRSVVLDPTISNPTDAVDVDAGFAGEWESSGFVDVSLLFGESRGTLFLLNVQAHGIEDQDQFNPDSRINDSDLVEGGQLLFMSFGK